MLKNRFYIRFKSTSITSRMIIVLSVILMIFTIFCVITPMPEYTKGFETISELDRFSKTLDENVKMDGSNILNPVYDKFYTMKYSNPLYKKIINHIRLVLFKLGLISAPPISNGFFKTLLIETLKERLTSGRHDDFIEVFKLDKNSKIVVFGPTQGAFHSLIRYLKKLRNLKIIGDDFHVTEPNYYIVFLGNVINRSPYTTELLSIVLKLLHSNQNNVVYLRGPHESGDTWKSHTMRNEIELQFKETDKNRIPLESEIDHFLSTLPTSIFFKVPKQNISEYDIIQISPHLEDDRIEKKIKMIQNSLFFENCCHTQHNIFNLKNINDDKLKHHETVSSVKAIIKGIKKRDLYEDMDGLRLLSYENGMLSWTVLSTASEPYQIGLGFFYEAFTIIEMIKNEWIINLFKRNLKHSKFSDFEIRTQNLFTGEKI